MNKNALIKSTKLDFKNNYIEIKINIQQTYRFYKQSTFTSEKFERNSWKVTKWKKLLQV